MRPQFLTFCIIVVLVMLGLLLWRRPAQPSSSTQPLQQQIDNSNVPVADMSNAHQSTSSVAPATAPSGTNFTIIESPLHKQLQTPEGFQKYVEGKNAPIEFYGKVIDQDSNALAGAVIKSAIRHWTAPIVFQMGSIEIPVERTSDKDGRFEISGETGDGFGIVITKDGYEAEPGQNGFGTVGGSYDNPVIFKMWSTNIHEKLISGQKSFHIVPDGRPYFIDLIDGTIAESGTGDLKVWVKRPDQITNGQRYDWSCEVDAINGGLQVTSDYSMYSAPPDGYVPSFQFEQTVGSGWGDSTGERRFYVTLNNGKEYGHITIELYAYYNNQIPGLIRLSYAVNPSGSLILR